MAPALDARAVEQKGRELLKAAESSASTSSLLSLLSELRTGVVANETLLRSTKIGVTVNKLKQHKDATVARTASELVSKWRTDVSKSRTGSGASTPKPGNTGSPVPASRAKNAAEPGAADVVKQKLEKSTVPKEKRNSREDKVNTKVTGNDTRDNCVRLMYDGIVFMSEACKFVSLI
jgi:transcription elongation factor S-II